MELQGTLCFRFVVVVSKIQIGYRFRNIRTTGGLFGSPRAGMIQLAVLRIGGGYARQQLSDRRAYSKSAFSSADARLYRGRGQGPGTIGRVPAGSTWCRV